MDLKYNYEDVDVGRPFKDKESQRWVFIGKSRSGKTYALIYALVNWMPKYDRYIVIAKEWQAQPIFDYLTDSLGEEKFEFHNDFDPNMLNELIYLQRMRVKWGVPKSVCLIMDDLLSVKGFKGKDATGILESIYATGRHVNLSCITTVQISSGVGQTVINNADLCVFETLNDFECLKMFRVAGVGDFKEFKEQILKPCWSEKRRPFIYKMNENTMYMGYNKKFTIVIDQGSKVSATSMKAADKARDDTITSDSDSDTNTALTLPQQLTTDVKTEEFTFPAVSDPEPEESAPAAAAAAAE